MSYFLAKLSASSLDTPIFEFSLKIIHKIEIVLLISTLLPTKTGNGILHLSVWLIKLSTLSKVYFLEVSNMNIAAVLPKQ